VGIKEAIKEEVMLLNQKYIDEVDNYNFWEQHVKYVVDEANELAIKYNADKEIVELAALLHDVALMMCVGERKDHHINGALIAESLLLKYNYPLDKIKKVTGCIVNHRSSKNATNNEELCVADADILAHFDNIPMLFNSAFKRCDISLDDINEWMREAFEKDYNDLSDRTKKEFKERYELICHVVLKNN
jgi:uncharacterized protein